MRNPTSDSSGGGSGPGLIQGRDIICISSIDWDFIWQGHQEIMSTLARNGNRVLYIENTGVRMPRLKDLPRLRLRLCNWWRGVKGFRQDRQNLFVYSPLILPFPYSRIAGWLNRMMLCRALRRWMRAAGFGRPIVWTFLPTPLALDVIRELNPELTVYYCIDDLASSSPAAQRISRTETELFKEADLVFVTSEKLRQRAARSREQVHLFPFGVDFEKFERVRTSGEPVPDDLKALSYPTVGYLGGLHQWVDQKLLADVARRLPSVSFALVGPAQTDVSALAVCQNIHLLGARPHAEVPRYLKGFDVGLVPYRLHDYTAHVYPTKLNEYLAMGMPVVATDLPEIRRFNQDHDDVVMVARDAERFADAITKSLANRDPGEVQRRIDVAKSNSWTARIACMSLLMEEALAARRVKGERWEEFLRRLYKTAHRRIYRTAAVAAALYVLLFFTPLLWVVATPLHVAESPEPADAIVVFAGGVGESGKAGGGYQERVKQAVELYRQGQAQWVVFSSGYTFVFREAEIMQSLAMSQGIPASAIVLETKAANTHDNVLFVSDILRKRGWQKILLVSSPYHMRRALLTWKKTASDITVISAPVPDSQFYSHQWGASLEQIEGILQEYAAIVVYWWRGWL